MNEYVINTSLVKGSGVQGCVVSAEHVPTSKRVVAKLTRLDTRLYEQLFLSEVEVYQKLAHCKNVVKMHTSAIVQPYGIIILERMPFDLMTLIERDCLSLKHRKKLFSLICEAVKEIHDAGVCHLDIKPENILVSVDYSSVKICDFGSARIMKHANIANGAKCGTLLYSAPEVITEKVFDGKKADIWSLGILYHVLVTSHWPFTSTATSEDIRARILSGTLDYFPGLRNSDLIIIEKMVQVSPQDRRDLSTLLKSTKHKKTLRGWFSKFLF